MSNNLQRVQAALRESEYPALLITSPTNRFYATGFHSSDGVAVITPDRALFATDFRYIEAARAEIQGFDVVMTDRQSKYTDIIGQFCADCGINALAFESQRLTYAEFEAFRENLTPELVPVGGFLEKLRLVKAPWELKRLRAAQEITERAFGEILKYIRESITELDLAAEIEYRMRRSGAAGASFDTIAASGPHSSMPHATPTARRLAPGDCVHALNPIHGYVSADRRFRALPVLPVRLSLCYLPRFRSVGPDRWKIRDPL